MAQTASNMIPLGTLAPNFKLPDTISGKVFSYGDLRGEKGTLVIFMCNHCPFVLHVIDEIVRIGQVCQAQQIGIVAISSNDVIKYPQDSPELMKAFAAKHQMDFPYLYDQSQEVAQAYDAACTPDFFLFDKQNKLFYRGQLDDSRPSNGIPVSGYDLRQAIDLMLQGKEPPEIQKPSIGCNIKWK
ncbi:thioredoxin family protein [Flavobacterium sp. CYK-4]|uniref:thioredoxin family protein n=1 Tax=Flavobacterium lotistagni TaxID=2709660 RepID=UPI001407D6F9|nr:thioredoxin family protein [Flavobacterium lotistagni]NHM06178.1 thioredoxin family protein [Flavobacterium lotistagni]